MQTENMAVAEEWLTVFWDKRFNPNIVDRLAASNMTLIYSLHQPCSRHRSDPELHVEFPQSLP